MKVLPNSFTASMMALCLLAPTVASAEDANSLKEGCRLKAAIASDLRTGTVQPKASSGTLLRLLNTESVYQQRFWLRTYGTHSSGFGKIVKLVQMSNGLCYRRPLGDTEHALELGICGDSKAEWILARTSTSSSGLYYLKSTTNTDYVWEPSGTTHGSYVYLRKWTGDLDQKWDFGSCRNMLNIPASPG